jgi:hypothetical protein
LVEKKETLARQIARFSDRIFGKPLTINDFRHSWEMQIQNSIEYQRASVEERKEMHAKLLHGHAIALQYNRVRRDEDGGDSNEL